MFLTNHSHLQPFLFSFYRFSVTTAPDAEQYVSDVIQLTCVYETL